MPGLKNSVVSIAEYTQWVQAVAERFADSGGYEAPWFRGVGNSEYTLVPGLYRTTAGRKKGADDELRTEFSRKALPLVADRAPRDEWEWYFLMQHYRAPTRLLDWTDSAMVALYFALAAAPQPGAKDQADTRPAVWALNPFTMNRHTRFRGPVGTGWRRSGSWLPRPYSGRMLPKLPIAIDPSFSAQRMLVQHSHFTLHGRDTRGIDEMRTALGLRRDLVKVVIDLDAHDRDYMQWHLRILGITETTIFPDLEGLARELRLEYGLD